MKKMSLGLAILAVCVSLPANPEKFAIEMVRIPGGSFQMGSLSGKSDEKPLHRVSISTFSLGKTAVTVGQFRAFVNKSGYRTEAERGDGSVVFSGRTWEKRRGVDWRQPGFSQNDSHPVTCVSWNDCREFIRWLNGRTGRHYRLPTEAEWEYAARGGAWYGANWSCLGRRAKNTPDDRGNGLGFRLAE